MRRPVLLCLMLPLGCLVFDEDLYQQAESASAGDDGSLELFSDGCIPGEVPVITESQSLNLDLTPFTSLGLGYPKCIEKQYQGPDAFFILDAKQGERWNMSAAPISVDQDLAIVVLGEDCSPSSCQRVRDRCGPGFDEEFALVAEEDKRYVVSVDSLSPTTSGSITLALNKSVCGNGLIESGESCDGGAGCDELCRREIRSGTVAEGEPNDIFTGVDMIGVPYEGGQVTITGSVGGPCDEDHYAFLVPDGASVSVHMFGPGGAPCAADTPEIALPLVDFWAPGGPLPIGAGKTGASSGGCPYFDNTGADPDFEFARNLPSSEYHLIVNAFETEQAIPYELVFDIQVTTPG